MTSASALEYRSRYELVEEARSLGVERPERMTMQELKDEILRLSVSEEEQLGARGLFGVARAMLASVVEAGLKMPDAAKAIRGDVSLELPVRSRSPVATVTLAEIYSAQGHRNRALAVLDEVLEVEPDHEEALRIRAELLSGDSLIPQAPASQKSPDLPAPPSPAPPSPAPTGVEARTEFPSTEYVPVDIVETTGHEAALTPAPAPVSFEPAPPEQAAPEQAVAPESPAPPEQATVPEPTAPADQEISVLGSEPVLATSQFEGALHLYWELPPDVVARSGLTVSEGGPALVVVAFTPAGPSPVRDQRTVRLAWEPPFTGSMTVPDLGPHAAVRAAVGWLVEETFLPLAVGRSVERLAVDAPLVAERAEAAWFGRSS